MCVHVPLSTETGKAVSLVLRAHLERKAWCGLWAGVARRAVPAFELAISQAIFHSKDLKARRISPKPVALAALCCIQPSR
jgi:hypothetical protein